MWYVIQTTTGKEQELVDAIHKMLPAHCYNECFYMKRQLLKRLGGKWLETTELLFPAYVFLDINSPEKIFYNLKGIPAFTKILGNNNGDFIPVEENEKEFLELLCQKENIQENGMYVVKSTKIYLDHDGAILKMEGPLNYFKRKINRMNLRKRYAVIELYMGGYKQNVLFGIKLEKDE